MCRNKTPYRMWVKFFTSPSQIFLWRSVKEFENGRDQILLFSIGLDGFPYRSVDTTLLHVILKWTVSIVQLTCSSTRDSRDTIVILCFSLSLLNIQMLGFPSVWSNLLTTQQQSRSMLQHPSLQPSDSTTPQAQLLQVSTNKDFIRTAVWVCVRDCSESRTVQHVWSVHNHLVATMHLC